MVFKIRVTIVVARSLGHLLNSYRTYFMILKACYIIKQVQITIIVCLATLMMHAKYLVKYYQCLNATYVLLLITYYQHFAAIITIVAATAVTDNIIDITTGDAKVLTSQGSCPKIMLVVVTITVAGKVVTELDTSTIFRLDISTKAVSIIPESCLQAYYLGFHYYICYTVSALLITTSKG